MTEEQHGTGAGTKAQPRMSVRGAALWAVKISVGCHVLLILIVITLGSLFYYRPVKLADRLFDAVTPGFVIWDAVFGGPWHSMVWLFSSFALNFIIYSAVIFVAEVVFMFWRRRLHPANTDSRLFP
jgi:hypothetical protein